MSGDPRLGGTVDAVFTSGWAGELRVEECEASHHLLLISAPGTEDETTLEAWLSPEGAGTRLIVEERGLPAETARWHRAGWQVHLEDLAASLASGAPVHPDGWSEQAAASAWEKRWQALSS